MYIVKYSFKNLFRNKRRTLITMSAISFGLFIAIVFADISVSMYTQMIESGVKSGAGDISVYKKGYLKFKDSRLFFNAAGLKQRISKISGVSTVLLRFIKEGIVKSPISQRACFIYGINYDDEKGINPFFKDFKKSNPDFKLEKNSAIIGEKLGRFLKVKKGGKVVLTFQDSHGELVDVMLRVSGFVKTGIKDVDQGIVFVNLSFIQEKFGKKGAVHEIAVLLSSRKLNKKVFENIKEIVTKSGQNLGVYGWEEAMPNLANSIKLDYTSQKIMVFIILIIIGIGIINTLMMSVMERYREFGVLRAVGGSGFLIVKIVLAESIILGVISIIIGAFLGFLFNLYLVKFGLDVSAMVPKNVDYGGVIIDPVIKGIWNFKDMISYSIFVLVISVLSGIYPAFKACRITPVESLRYR